MNWVSVCKVGEVSEDSPFSFKVEDKEVGVFKVEDAFYAIEDVCPHAYALLTQGFVEGRTVECPLHEAIFDIPTGKLESGPGCRNLVTYPVRVEGDDIQLQVA